MINIINNKSDKSIVKDITSQTFMTEVIEASKITPIIVDFWAPWCEPCKQLAPILEDAVLKKKNKITLVKVNIDENQDIATQLQIQSLPTVYVFYEGKVVDGFQGIQSSSQINDFINKVSSLSGPGADIEDLLELIKIELDNRNWNEVSNIAQKILEINAESNEAFGYLIKSLIGQNKFNEVREMSESISDEIRNSKIVSEALLTLDTSEKAFIASGKILDLEVKLKENPNDLQVNLDMAIALYGNSQISDSFDLLLKLIEIDSKWNEQAARKQLVEFFKNTGFDSKETISARRKLSSLLFS